MYIIFNWLVKVNRKNNVSCKLTLTMQIHAHLSKFTKLAPVLDAKIAKSCFQV